MIRHAIKIQPPTSTVKLEDLWSSGTRVIMRVTDLRDANNKKIMTLKIRALGLAELSDRYGARQVTIGQNTANAFVRRITVSGVFERDGYAISPIRAAFIIDAINHEVRNTIVIGRTDSHRHTRIVSVVLGICDDLNLKGKVYDSN